MKSAGNRGVFRSRLQVLHVHVLFVAPLGTGHMVQPCADQHEGGVAIREDPHHTGPAADLPVRPLNHVVGADPGPVLAGKVAVSQRFLIQLYNSLKYGLQSPFRMVCGNFILPEFCKPCLFLCPIQFAQLIVPYLQSKTATLEINLR